MEINLNPAHWFDGLAWTMLEDRYNQRRSGR